MRQRFRHNIGLSPANLKKLDVVNRIIDEYAKGGYRLTLRQLYYQLVSRDIIPNDVREYAKLSSLLVKGRMAGQVDWTAIEDRIRVPYLPYWSVDVADAIDATINQFRLDRLRDQDVYIELWVEKDALSGVLKKITRKYHINLMVNRGYSSCTAMFDASRRLRQQEELEKDTYILYLGDHDPSGLDMIRDIEDRLGEFGVAPDVIPLGITMDQIRQYNPPPNPAKITDPRAKWYIERYGNTSWEVDALNPEVLLDLVEEKILDLIDEDRYQASLDKEDKGKERLRKFQEMDGEMGEDEDLDESGETTG